LTSASLPEVVVGSLSGQWICVIFLRSSFGTGSQSELSVMIVSILATGTPLKSQGFCLVMSMPSSAITSTA
jgi:hypothetical protein